MLNVQVNILPGVYMPSFFLPRAAVDIEDGPVVVEVSLDIWPYKAVPRNI